MSFEDSQPPEIFKLLGCGCGWKPDALPHLARFHLKKLMKYARLEKYKRIVLIADNCPVYRSVETKRFLKRNRSLKVFNLPSYSPNLNEVEHINRRYVRPRFE